MGLKIIYSHVASAWFSGKGFFVETLGHAVKKVDSHVNISGHSSVEIPGDSNRHVRAWATSSGASS